MLYLSKEETNDNSNRLLAVNSQAINFIANFKL